MNKDTSHPQDVEINVDTNDMEAEMENLKEEVANLNAEVNRIKGRLTSLINDLGGFE